MAFLKLQFRPGLNRDTTNYANEGGWYACDKIRFRSGYPQKIGGWTKQITETIIGRSYQMWNWITTYGDNFLAIGTHKKLYIQVGTDLFDITPIRAQFTTPATDDCLTFTQGSNVVTVNLTGHGGITGDTIIMSGVVGVTPGEIAGIPLTEINTTHEITVINNNSFTFTTTTPANIGLGYGIGNWGDGLWGIGGASTTFTGGGSAIVIDFEINIGYPITTYGYGWGTSTWSRGTWGSGSVQPVFLPQRDWWFDNFDNDLVANIRDGEIYYWERGTNPNPTTALNAPAVLLSELANTAGYDPDAVPVKVMQCLVSQNDKHLLAFGAVPFGSTDPDDFDPLLIRWASQDNPFEWTPQNPNSSAGDLRVSRGSEIVRALPTRQEILVWTNSNLYSLQFLGTTDVFGLQELADNISIIGPRAAISANNITFWMGADKFYMYTGRVDTLPCTLMQHVFENINFNQADQIVCGTNEQWNEVWWFYPSATSDYNDSYVIYNHREQVWYYGTIDRTAWLDSPLRSYPQAIYTDNTTQNGTLYFHETSVDADGAPLVSYLESSDYDLEDGYRFMLTKRIIPDISFARSTAQNPEVTLTLQPKNFPGSAVIQETSNSQPVIETAVNQYTNQVFIRARARQIAFKISSADLGVSWQLGNPRLDGRTDGER